VPQSQLSGAGSTTLPAGAAGAGRRAAAPRARRAEGKSRACEGHDLRAIETREPGPERIVVRE
jgi:hypothetical protein